MMHVKQFTQMVNETSILSYRHGWIPSKPIKSPFIVRLKDAYLVLIGEAEAVKFNSPEETIKMENNCESKR